jgi:putative sterol carrier protein
VPAFPSDEWFRDFSEVINASPEYAESSAGWEGDVAFLIAAEPDNGVPRDVYAILDLWHGRCRGTGLVDRSRAEAAEFLLSAPYSRWREVIDGTLDPVKGMMQGKLKVRGDLQKILRYIKATRELARLTNAVDTTFRDGG